MHPSATSGLCISADGRRTRARSQLVRRRVPRQQPLFAAVRYIGAAYLMLGDLPHAKEHLKTLDSLCFITCSEYRDLKRAVEAYEKSGGKAKPTASQ